MRISSLIRQVCKDMNISLAELARRTDQTPQNLSMKLKRESISFEEFQRYMQILDIRIDFNLIYPDGKTPAIFEDDERVMERIGLLEAKLALLERAEEYEKKLNIDMRTAFFSMDGYVDLALKHAPDREYMEECLKKIKVASLHMNSLLNNTVYVTAREPEIDTSILLGKTILVVEDDEMNREIITELLESKGAKVEIAEEGESAVAKVKKAEAGHFDGILMDHFMPNMDGVEATKKIRNLPDKKKANIPIIAMTASAYEEDQKESLEAGMNAYLIKPVEISLLTKTLSQFLK